MHTNQPFHTQDELLANQFIAIQWKKLKLKTDRLNDAIKANNHPDIAIQIAQHEVHKTISNQLTAEYEQLQKINMYYYEEPQNRIDEEKTKKQSIDKIARDQSLYDINQEALKEFYTNPLRFSAVVSPDESNNPSPRATNQSTFQCDAQRKRSSQNIFLQAETCNDNLRKKSKK